MDNVPDHIAKLLEQLADALQIPPDRYRAAEKRYRSVGEWLSRKESGLKAFNPEVYIQGSFRLGTAIQPVSEKEDYDVDLVCEVGMRKETTTQEGLKISCGHEIRAYAKAHGMKLPKEGRRCWTLSYADGAQFHLDVLPAIPDGPSRNVPLTQKLPQAKFSEGSIAITDQKHPNYRKMSSAWSHSNPKGYGAWFHSRMATIFEERRQALALQERTDIDEIPRYRVRTPLQSVIQILKRHRDIMFADQPSTKPISIILTTLAAHAYDYQSSVGEAFYHILGRMDRYIENGQGVAWIPNPSDPTENFADKWQQHPHLKRAFYAWLKKVRHDFSSITSLSQNEALRMLRPVMGKKTITKMVVGDGGAGHAPVRPPAKATSGSGIILNPPHRKSPPWGMAKTQGTVRIERVVVRREGFRQGGYRSNGQPLPKNTGLRFFATTDLRKPYKTYWQVVNMGSEAVRAGDLRGGFDGGTCSDLVRNETTRYKGRHSIECFIVKNERLVARSGQFLVNIV